ncbi:MAG TPA: MFS transporter [Acidimicrobiia bacterium]|nr:MFS transporter [Acidimicrobiia bacterium]
MLVSPLGRAALARFISRVGGEAAFFVGIWGKATYEFQATAAQLAVVMGALGVASLVGSLWSGYLVDRWGPRRVLVVFEITFVPAALAVTMAESLGQLTILVFLIALLGAPIYTAVASLGPYLTDDVAELTRINSWLEGAGWAAFIVGPAAGALAVRYLSLDAIFVLDAATSLVGALLVAGIRLRPVPPAERQTGFREEITAGARYVLSRADLRFVLLAGSSVWLAFGAFSALEPLFYREVLKTGPEALGWVNSLFGVGLVTGTLMMPKLPAFWRSTRGLATVVALNGLGGLIYVGTDRMVVVVAGALVWGAVIGVMVPVYRTILHTRTPHHLTGRVQAASQTMADSLRLVPLLVVPALAVRYGVQPVLIVNVVLLALLGVSLLPLAHRYETSPKAS